MDSPLYKDVPWGSPAIHCYVLDLDDNHDY